MIQGAVGFGAGGFLGLLVYFGLDSLLLAWLGPGTLHLNISTLAALPLAGAVGGAALRAGWMATVGFGAGFLIGFLPTTYIPLLPIGLQGMPRSVGFDQLWIYFALFTSSPLRFAVSGAIGMAVLGRLEQGPRVRFAIAGALGFGIGALIGGTLGALLAYLWFNADLPGLGWPTMLASFLTPFIIGGAVAGSMGRNARKSQTALNSGAA